jgi:hypothetical protein
MNRLEAVLDEFVNGPGAPPAVKLGAEAGPPLDPARAAALEERLRSLRRGLEVYFIICVAMIVVLFVAEVAVVLMELSSPALATAAMTAFGVSTAGLIVFMTRLWRDRDRTGTIIALAEALEPADLRAVLQVMLEQQYGPRPAAGGAAADASGGAPKPAAPQRP